jgi:hypothetical protein
VTPLERLRQAAELLPAGASVTVTREALLEVLGGPPLQTSAQPAGDLTVEQLAAHFKCSGSTVRGWLERGLLLGAYRLPGEKRAGAWRVPAAALEAFRGGTRPRAVKRSRADLSAWRQHRRPA